MSDYSVVVVAHNQPRQVLGALLALRQRARPAEVILVDNASTSPLDGPVALSQLPVTTVRLHAPLSLAAAFNAGLDAAHHDAVLLLHADTLLLSDPAAAVALLHARPDAGIVGGKLFQDTPSPRRLLHVWYDVCPGRTGVSTVGRAEWDTFHSLRDVGAVSDACMLVRRTDLRFDERYWFVLQDVDFCHQHQQLGARVLFCPDLQAIHLESGGARLGRRDPTWAARQLDTYWLHHRRWASDEPISHHPCQTAMRGAAAFLRQTNQP
ncbi:MAG TPA: glycosyltransferase [Chloroflexota bacterium]|nr:glycosyltransferase [Chloroflexota bacterium]